jgi:hypothetical protein
VHACVYLCEEEKCYGQKRIAGFGGLNDNSRVQCVITIYTELVLLYYCLHLGTGNRRTLFKQGLEYNGILGTALI